MAQYPSHLVKTVPLKDGTNVVIRPIRPEDAAMEQAFVKALSDSSRYYRFMDAIRELPKPMLEHFTHIDYEHEMALVAVVHQNGADTQIGVARYVVYPDGKGCEFAVVVADAWHGKGVGTTLMRELMAVARAKGIESIEGIVLASNQKMLRLMKSLGFSIEAETGDPTLRHVKASII
jgi:acetyltransferase